jgi:hypothetical protein
LLRPVAAYWHGDCFSSGIIHAPQRRENNMSTAPRTATPEADQLPKDLVELTAAVTELPAQYRAKIEAILQRVNESTRRRRRILALVQEALSQLRLDMKYLMFDLEATRRERDALKHRGEE